MYPILLSLPSPSEAVAAAFPPATARLYRLSPLLHLASGQSLPSRPDLAPDLAEVAVASAASPPERIWRRGGTTTASTAGPPLTRARDEEKRRRIKEKEERASAAFVDAGRDRMPRSSGPFWLRALCPMDYLLQRPKSQVIVQLPGVALAWSGKRGMGTKNGLGAERSGPFPRKGRMNACIRGLNPTKYWTGGL
uniref:Uncharacterized protein n=1 Tax=Oryza sativa subsp. japonica TaxID=39947 RepID=Q6Z9Y3_ORYSJ|nr:hypothetical protein [Oryza sativa Japonica Group]BAC99593.1 hypothetical protein [Oryza sativa Japonica Group]